MSQVVLNIATTDTANNQAGIDQDTIMKFIAATISALGEYILNSTWKIRSAATSAIRLILSHGLAKVSGSQNPNQQALAGFEKVYANIQYFLSSRYTESSNN